MVQDEFIQLPGWSRMVMFEPARVSKLGVSGALSRWDV